MINLLTNWRKQVQVILRPTASRPVCPRMRPPCGTSDQFFFLSMDIIFRHLQLFCMGRPLWWEDEFVFTRTHAIGSSQRCHSQIQVLQNLRSLSHLKLGCLPVASYDSQSYSESTEPPSTCEWGKHPAGRIFISVRTARKIPILCCSAFVAVEARLFVCIIGAQQGLLRSCSFGGNCPPTGLHATCISP
jgi:hypothetical protein